MSARRTAAAALAIGASTASVAHAAQPPPSLPTDVPAVYQYREAVPTGGGSVAPRGGGHPVALAPQITARIRSEAGADAPALERVARSPSYGAPAGRASASPSPGGPRPEARPLPTQATPSMLGAVFAALGGSDTRMVGLLAILAALSAAAAAASVWSRRPAA